MPLYALAIFLFVAIAFSVLINGLFLRFSRNLGMRGEENQNLIRWGSTSKPSLGGISFYIIFLVSISVISILPDNGGDLLNKELIGLLTASTLGFLIGLADDAFNTNPLVKFIGQFTVAWVLLLTGYVIQITPYESFNYAFTMIWIIGLMNSINMLDNMDAITATTSLSVIIGALTLLWIDGSFDSIYAIVLVGVAGGLLGFLYYNWNPSKMYMGDTGSQFLGVFLAAISISFIWNYKVEDGPIFQWRQLIMPMLIFTVPLIDTTTVVVRRLLRRTSPFVGGRDHVTHHLAYLGLSDRMVAITLLSISLLSIVLAGVIFVNYDTITAPHIISAFVYFASVFAIIQLLYNRGANKHKLAQE